MEGKSGEGMKHDKTKTSAQEATSPLPQILFVLYQTIPNPCMEFKKI